MSNDKGNVVATIIMVAAALAFIFIVMFAVRWFNNTATKITVHEVEPGIHCALATSSDGVALDCWRIE